MTTLTYPSAQLPGPPIGRAVQAHLFAGARRGQVVDLTQVTGPVGGEQAASEYPSLPRLPQTVRVSR